MPEVTETQQFAIQHVDRLLGQLAFQVKNAMQSKDAEAIHDLRVVIRRFTQVLSTFEPCFPAKPVKRVRRRLRRIMKLAGNVRNYDVAMNLVARLDPAEADRLESVMQGDRKEASRGLIDALARWVDRSSSLKWRVGLEVKDPMKDQVFCRSSIEKTARRTLSPMAKDFVAQGTGAARAGASMDELHRFRISGKRFRYTLELFAPLYGPMMNAWLEQIRAIQTILGDVNDCETVCSITSGHDCSPELQAALKKRLAKKAGEFRRQWSEVFADPETARRFRNYLRCFAGRRNTEKKPVTGGVSQRTPLTKTQAA